MTPDKVAALVKRLREEASFSGTLLDNSLKTLVREAADALESPAPPAGMVMMPSAKLLNLTIRLASGVEVEVHRYREHGSVIVGGKERAPEYPKETDDATRVFTVFETMLSA